MEHWKYGIVVSLVGLIGFESFCRRRYPEKLFRPTVAMNRGTMKLKDGCSWVGYQLARVTDLYHLIREYFPYEDMKNLLLGGWGLVTAPMWTLKGWVEYFADSYVGRTLSEYRGVAMVSSLVVLGSGVLAGAYWYRCPRIFNSGYLLNTPIENLFEKFKVK